MLRTKVRGTALFQKENKMKAQDMKYKNQMVVKGHTTAKYITRTIVVDGKVMSITVPNNLKP